MAQSTYRMTIAHSCAGQFAINVLHWRFDDAGFTTTSAAANALLDAWAATNLAGWKAMLPSDTTLLSLKGRKVSGTGGFETVKIFTAGTVGTRSGTISAAGISPCIILFGLGQVKTRGRIFLCGLSENDASAGVYTEAYKTAIATQSDIALDDVTLIGGGAPVATNVIFRPSTKVAIDVYKRQLSDTIGTIRRRQVPA